MIPLVSSSVMNEIDKKAQKDFYIPGIILMENAGIKTYQFIKQKIFNNIFDNGIFLFLVGRGNNGGDALVIARQMFLEDKKELIVLLSNGDPNDDSNCMANLKICRELGIQIIYLLDYALKTNPGHNMTLRIK